MSGSWAGPGLLFLALAAGEATPLSPVERLGRDIYRADITSWLTTDQITAGGVDKRVPGKQAGWVTSPMPGEPDIWRAAYLGRKGDQAFVYADGSVDFSQGKPLASLRENSPPRAVDAGEQAMMAARMDAVGRDWLACGPGYNSVVLADEAGGWRVYLIPPQSSAKVYPLGGFHRFRYDASGKFLDHFSQTRGCLEQSEAGLPEGATLSALMISHLNSPEPTELHVYMNLAFGKPIFVATSDGQLWRIEEGRVHADSGPEPQPDTQEAE